MRNLFLGFAVYYAFLFFNQAYFTNVKVSEYPKDCSSGTCYYMQDNGIRLKQSRCPSVFADTIRCYSVPDGRHPYDFGSESHPVTEYVGPLKFWLWG